jgi:hypothetical protein
MPLFWRDVPVAGHDEKFGLWRRSGSLIAATHIQNASPHGWFGKSGRTRKEPQAQFQSYAISKLVS